MITVRTSGTVRSIKRRGKKNIQRISTMENIAERSSAHRRTHLHKKKEKKGERKYRETPINEETTCDQI